MSSPSWTQILLMMRIICRVSMSWRRSSPHWMKEDSDRNHLPHFPQLPDLPGGQPWPRLVTRDYSVLPPHTQTCSHQVKHQRWARNHILPVWCSSSSPNPTSPFALKSGSSSSCSLPDHQSLIKLGFGTYTQQTYVTKSRMPFISPTGLSTLRLSFTPQNHGCTS